MALPFCLYLINKQTSCIYLGELKMSLLKSLLSEEAAGGSTGGSSIAVNIGGKKGKKKKKGGLFAGGMISRVAEAVGCRRLLEQDDFDMIGTEAKLKNSERLSKSKASSKAFGLQDDDGNTVKIYVKASDADEFERELESALNSDKSVAEIVFDLNREFDIIDAEWGEIPEDEEEQIPMPKGNQGANDQAAPAPDANADPNAKAQGDEQAGGDDELSLDDAAPGDEGGEDNPDDVKSALNQIIDMLKSDVQAKKAEAEAKKAEAEAKKALQLRKAQEAKSKQDAELLDAEEFFKSKKEEDRKQKQMDLLARYHYEKGKSEDKDEFDISALESVSTKMANMMFENFKNQSRKSRRII